MSRDDIMAGLRDQLVRGAQRRRRAERRRRIVLMSLATVMIVVVIGALLRSRDVGSEITTGPASQHSVEEACDAVADMYAAFFTNNDAQLEAARIQFEKAAASSGDAALASLGAGVADGDQASYSAAVERCRELDAEAFTPHFVPAVSSPEPSVRLSDYGTVHELAPFVDDIPGLLANTIVGRNLSNVRAATTDDGAYLARWSYGEPNGRRQHCYRTGSPSGAGGGCGPERQGPELRAGVGGSNNQPLVSVFSTKNASFVVLETAMGAYVQRPASGIAVFWLDHPVAFTDRIRNYAANGAELTCHRVSDPQPC